VRSSRRLEVLNNKIYIANDKAIVCFDCNGLEQHSISIPNKINFINFIALTDGRFALLDYQRDTVSFIDYEGSLLHTAQTPKKHIGMGGVQVDHKLIISAGENKRIIAIDLNDYKVTIFKDLSHLDGWLGAIDYANEYYYVCQRRRIYSFARRSQYASLFEESKPTLLATLPEGNITGIKVEGEWAYVTVYSSGKVYRVNLKTGNYEEFAKNLKDPVDIDIKYRGSSPSDLSEALVSLQLDVIEDILDANPKLVNATLYGLKQTHPMQQRSQTPLHWAVCGGPKELVELLISKGADVNHKGDFSRTPLHSAVYAGRKEVVEFLISKGADINHRKDSGLTPLHHAILRGDKEMAEILIIKGAVVDGDKRPGRMPLYGIVRHTFSYGGKEMGLLAKRKAKKKVGANSVELIGCTPLFYAIQLGHKDMAELLIAKGASIDLRDIAGYTPLFYAVQYGRKEIAELLISNGADVNAQDIGGYVLLNYATGSFKGYAARSFNQDIDIIKLLFKHGAGTGSEITDAVLLNDLEGIQSLLARNPEQINVRDSLSNASVLHYAMLGRKKDLVEFLISHGADVNAKDDSNSTPLHTAAKIGQQDLVKLLIANRANTNARDSSGSTPLHKAASTGQIEIVKFFIANGVDVDSTDNNGSTPLHLASAGDKKDKDIAKLLIGEKANVNAKDNDGKTPLHRATESSRIEVIQLLIANGAETDSADNNGSTPLHLASAEGKRDIAKLLIDEKANVNFKDHEGNTPLHLAVLSRHKDMVLFLIENEANVDTKNEGDKTPLDLAIDRNERRIARLLKKHGAIESKNTIGRKAR
jgi:ankyrin repeat protein